MKIIILGAGQVGGTLAENLVGENNDITLVDTNGDRPGAWLSPSRTARGGSR